MREILFRGKPKDKADYQLFSQIQEDNCEDGFVYGSLVVSKGKYYICVSVLCKINSLINNDITTMIEVIPETIGQYTGINIGNEKLFEGDIVECHEDYDDSWGYTKTSIVRAVVIWDEENFCWAFIIENKYRQPFNDWTWNNSFINGNIHDNHKLLKEGAEK